MDEQGHPVGDPDAPRPALPRVRVFGLDFIDADSIDAVADEVLELAPVASDLRPSPIVVTPNVDQLVHVDRGTDAIASQVIRRATHVLPDGQPIVWASSLLGAPLSARLPGSSLVATMWPRLVERGQPVVVVASSPQIAALAEAEGGHVRAIVAPQLSLADRAGFDDFVDDTVELIRRSMPTHVFVTLAFPKRCNVIDGIDRRLRAGGDPVPVLLAIGASFDMYYGLVRRAPMWMQRAGLEWLFRFLQEPRRLFRRYFIDDPVFVRLVLQEWRARRRGS